MPAVSVVIPTFNNEHYITDAVESVLGQSFKDIELLVVDDGSTDHTKDALRRYGDSLTYHYQPNQGLAVARNTGLQLATGDFITYLDADDIWEPHNLRAKVQLLQQHVDIAGVFSEFSIFDASGTTAARGTKATFPVFERMGWDFGDIFAVRSPMNVDGLGELAVYRGSVFDRLFFGNFILPTSMLFRRAVASRIGTFVPHMRTQQDYEYWLRFSRHDQLAFIDWPLVRYRRHPQQLTNFRNIERIFRAVLEIIEKYESDFASRGASAVYDRRVGELLRNTATTLLRKGESGEARSLLWRSLRYQPLSTSTYLAFSLSLIPPQWFARAARLTGKAS